MKPSNKLPIGLLLLNLLAITILIGMARHYQPVKLVSGSSRSVVKAVRVPFFSVIQIHGRAYLAKNLESAAAEK